jgi:hypothetical protein
METMTADCWVWSSTGHVAAPTRCTTLVPMPSFLPILRMPSPSGINSSIRASTEGSTVAGGAEGEIAPG